MTETPVVTANVAAILALFGVTTDNVIERPPQGKEHFDLEKARQSLQDDVQVVKWPPDSQENESHTETCVVSGMRHMRTMSVFSGAGGMDIGLALRSRPGNGRFRTQWAVDACPMACHTFQGHHPKAIVLNKDAGEALQFWTSEKGLAEGPAKGNVDVLVLGPPCQPFSKLNRSDIVDKDPRKLLVATALSYVDAFRPAYGVLEGVEGILNRGSLGTSKGDGTIKFIRATLLALGYKMRIGIVKCSHFGIPQHLVCLVILFAQDSLTVPELPTPVPGWPRSVSIEEATSDLPRWELTNPCRIVHAANAMAEARPSRLRPPRFSAGLAPGKMGKRRRLAGPSVAAYMRKPQNAFQRQVRQPQHRTVSQHQCSSISDLSIERICNVPCRPGANFLYWYHGQEALLGDFIDTLSRDISKFAFARLDKNGKFSTRTAQLNFSGAQGALLMPDQHRLPTFRELARAQGFPDAVRFHGPSRKIVEQISWAVPPPLAQAIGASIARAAEYDWVHRGERRFARQHKSHDSAFTSRDAAPQ